MFFYVTDTHCHINMMVKDAFDRPLTQQELLNAQAIAARALSSSVNTIINVGTNIIESKNCIALALHYKNMYATIGIHPNDITDEWKKDLSTIERLLQKKSEHKIVGVGECGIDTHYPGYNLERQKDCFRAQIELALRYEVGLVVHSRDAADETLAILSDYKNDLLPLRTVMHCFSYDASIATDVIAMGCVLGIGAPCTYPKNHELRSIITNNGLEHIVLETDAPFLPPQHLRGKQNSPEHIRTIAEFIAHLRSEPLDLIAQITTHNAQRLFNLL